MKIEVKIKNLDQIKAAFKKAPLLMANNLNKAIRYSINTLQHETIPITPIDKGGLRQSLERGVYFSYLVGRLVPEVEYAIYVHEGTRNWPVSQPPKAPGTKRKFLAEGLKKSDRQIQRFFELAVRDTLNEISRRAK